jgi:hypothetical protein
MGYSIKGNLVIYTVHLVLLEYVVRLRWTEHIPKMCFTKKRKKKTGKEMGGKR